jgi:hypothetical protein
MVVTYRMLEMKRRRREAKIVNKAVLALPPQNQGVEFKKKNHIVFYIGPE